MYVCAAVRLSAFPEGEKPRRCPQNHYYIIRPPVPSTRRKYICYYYSCGSSFSCKENFIFFHGRNGREIGRYEQITTTHNGLSFPEKIKNRYTCYGAFRKRGQFLLCGNLRKKSILYRYSIPLHHRQKIYGQDILVISTN